MNGTDPLSRAIAEWHDREWPNPDGTPAGIDRIVMKLAEEVGELSGAIVKHVQGRTDKDWLSEAAKEYGDVRIVLAVLADRMSVLCGQELTPEGMTIDRFDAVSKRRGSDYRIGTPISTCPLHGRYEPFCGTCRQEAGEA